MNKTLLVAKWEFLEKVKSKAFVISLFLTPLLLILFSVAPTLLITAEEDETKVIGILDFTNEYFDQIIPSIESIKLKNNIPAYITQNLFVRGLSKDSMIILADKKALDKKVEGYLLIENKDSLIISYRSKSVGSFKLISDLEKVVNDINIKKTLLSKNVDLSVVELIKNRIEINPVKIKQPGEEGDSEFLSTFFSSMIFILLLMTMVIYSGQMLVRSLLEEKSNRLIEILVSSCTPNELLFGKIIGLSLLGIAQILAWILIGIAAVGTTLVSYSSFENLPTILLYFLIGYLFYTSLFVGIGSIVSTEQEAQQITSYLSIILVLPVVFLLSAMQNPDSTFVNILSYIPFTLPTVMMIKANLLELSLLEHLVAISIMFISTLIVVFLSGKIFRIGILSYGKMPSLKELISWLKE
ncbi:MAG: ABC transporter permease [Ignavibacterium sp.]|nr:ABC transporter permease [Ignavibacterium sp.]